MRKYNYIIIWNDGKLRQKIKYFIQTAIKQIWYIIRTVIIYFTHFTIIEIY